MSAIAFFTLQSVTSGHGGLFLFLALLALGSYLVVRRHLPPVRTLARDVGVAGALLLALNLPFLVPYFRVQRELGLRRTIGAVYDWVPNAASFLASPTHVDQALLSLVPPLESAVADAKAYMFPGWLTLLLVGSAPVLRAPAAGIAAHRPGRPRLGFYARARRCCRCGRASGRRSGSTPRSTSCCRASTSSASPRASRS